MATQVTLVDVLMSNNLSLEDWKSWFSCFDGATFTFGNEEDTP